MFKRHRAQIADFLVSRGIESSQTAELVSGIADILSDRVKNESPTYRDFSLGDHVVVTKVNEGAVICYDGQREGFGHNDVSREGVIVGFDRTTRSTLNVQVDFDGRKVWGNTSFIRKV